MEFLREKAHLRFRTNTFGAIFRIRALDRQFTVIAGVEANQFVNQVGTEFLSGKDFWKDFVKYL